MLIEIKDKLHQDIVEYCKNNNIVDVNKFINKTLREHLTINKYGELKQPKTEKPIVKEDNELFYMVKQLYNHFFDKVIVVDNKPSETDEIIDIKNVGDIIDDSQNQYDDNKIIHHNKQGKRRLK